MVYGDGESPNWWKGGCVVCKHWRKVLRHLFGFVQVELEQMKNHGISEKHVAHGEAPWC